MNHEILCEMPKGKSIALHITLHRLAGFIWLTYQKPISNKLPCLTTGINSNDRCYQKFLVTDWQVKPIIYIFTHKVCFQNKEREERCKRGREHLNITCEKLTRSERQQICHKKTKQEQNSSSSKTTTQKSALTCLHRTEVQHVTCASASKSHPSGYHQHSLKNGGALLLDAEKGGGDSPEKPS